MHSSLRVWTLAVCLTVSLSMMVATDQAQAAGFYQFLNSFDTTSLGPSTTTGNLSGIAYDAGTNSFYLTDPLEDVVLHVTPTGTSLGSFSTANLGTAIIPPSLCVVGCESSLTSLDIAYVPSSGHLFIVDTPTSGPRTMYEVTAAGQFVAKTDLGALGITGGAGIEYDTAGDRLLITDFQSDAVFRLTTAGVLIDSFSIGGFANTSDAADGIAQLPSGVLLISDTVQNNVYGVGNANGMYFGLVTLSGIPGTIPFSLPTGLEVRPSDGHLFVTLDQNQVLEFAPAPEPGSLLLLGMGLVGLTLRRRSARPGA